MTNKTIDNRRPVGGDYFRLGYDRRDDRKLIDHLDKFNINEYYIYKITGKQRQVTIDDFYEFKYSGYIFFKKDIFNKEYIDKWIEWLNKNMAVQYLSKPLPPFNPSKIIIKQ